METPPDNTPTRREALTVAAASGLLAALLLRGPLLSGGDLLPGRWRAWGQGWAAARMGWTLTGQEPPAVDGTPILVGGPISLTIASLAAVFDLPLAMVLACWLWVALGIGATYAAARRLGATPLGASGGALAAGLSPAVVNGLADGRYEWLAAAPLALAMGGAKSEEWRGSVLAGVAVAFCALLSPTLGLCTLPVVALVAAGRSWKKGLTVSALGAAAVLALGWSYRHGVQLRPDPRALTDLRWIVSTAGPIPLLLGALLAARGSPALVIGATVGMLLAVGSVPAWDGQPLPFAGPVAWLAYAFGVPTHQTWSLATLPAFAAAGLALSRGNPKVSLAIGLITAVQALLPTLPTVDGRVPLGVRQLAGQEGAVVDLPLEGPRTPEGQSLRYLYFQAFHGRPTTASMNPDMLLTIHGEPIVVLVANAVEEKDAFAIPAARPAAVLQALKARTLVLHRDALGPGALALSDRVLARGLTSPQRDLVGSVDIYDVPAGPSEAGTQPVPLVGVGDHVDGWLSPTDYLERWK